MLNNNLNKVFIGATDRLEDWKDSGLNKIKVLLKSYLELDNVSFLFGAGSSIHLGSISIANIPITFEDELKKIPNKIAEDDDQEAYQEFLSIMLELQGGTELERILGMIKYPIEELLNYLNALQFVALRNSTVVKLKYLDEIIDCTKRVLFELCDLDQLPAKPSLKTSDVEKNMLSTNRYYYHERLVKKILQRPLSLKRANIFTTNYDLAFENAFDNQGVNYIDGFSGFQNRTFKPETFDYDIYYPGSTTQGKVSRIEKVIRYYKIHGSLTWIKTPPSATNIYGIKEVPISLIRELKKDPALNLTGDIMIYPSATKKSYTLDFPYSELFRQFSASITQSQSMLLTYGYSFGDEHINDIIYQALSIPSFTLIVVDYLGIKNAGIKKLMELNDPRIIILEGSQLGDFLFFTQFVMPDLVEINTDELVANTMNKIYTVSDVTLPISDEEPTIASDRTDAPTTTATEVGGEIDDLPF